MIKFDLFISKTDRDTIIVNIIFKNRLNLNTKSFIKVFVSDDMVGHKLGEFAATRTFKGHAADRKSR